MNICYSNLLGNKYYLKRKFKLKKKKRERGSVILILKDSKLRIMDKKYLES